MSQSFYHAVFTTNFNNTTFKYNIAIIDEAKNIILSYEQLHIEVMAFKEILKKNLPSVYSSSHKGIVALNISKNSKFIIAQLACSYLNIAFLPLDTIQKNRNKEILDMVKPMIIINDDSLLSFEEYQNVSHETDYVIFSSGSTGKPKGILMKGEPAVDIVSQQSLIIGISPGDKYIWLLSPAFDASLSDIYSTFVAHGVLVIPNFDTTKIKKLCQYIQDNNISYMDLPPSMFSLFYKAFTKYQLKSLKGIIFGGESASETITKSLAQHFNMFQAYGPTETTICSSMSKITDESNIYDIGTPMKNLKFKILNNELLISGHILSLGYLNNDNLNNEKFIEINNELWFKTGDCVDYINNQYLYNGRLDRQFKFNSQLISPEEIETKALKYGASFCHIHFDGKIHMYYQGKLNISEFKDSLAKYMIPHFINEVNHIKNIAKLLNSNHKFDHKLFIHNLSVV